MQREGETMNNNTAYEKADLHNRAMLIKLSISQWSARKFDKKITHETNQRYGTDDTAGRYNKALVAREAIKKIEKKANAARTFHEHNTLPWSDHGFRLLPSENFLEYSKDMRKLKSEFFYEVHSFINDYPALVDQAKELLNGMFDPLDYPAPDTIENKFSFDTSIYPLPIAEDFRVSLQQDAIEEIKHDIESRFEAAHNTAMIDLWERVHKNVAAMAERLTGKDAKTGKEKTFRDSLVNNLIDLCDLLPRLNIANDHNLDTMRRNIESKLLAHDPQTLRDDSTARQETAQAANDILAAMAGYIGK